MVFGLELKFEIIILMPSHHLLSMIAALLILISLSVSADYHNKSWKPQAIKNDWLQLTSGEWLKGELMNNLVHSLHRKPEVSRHPVQKLPHSCVTLHLKYPAIALRKVLRWSILLPVVV
jgi:hypothetical protein